MEQEAGVMVTAWRERVTVFVTLQQVVPAEEPEVLRALPRYEVAKNIVALTFLAIVLILLL